MVGSLLIWKLIHCKRLKKKNPLNHEDETPENTLSHNSVEVITIKKELDETQTCRVCLKDGDIPIYNNSLEDLTEALYIFGGIEVKFDDEYPKYLCQPCHALLQGAILFRRTAQESNQILHQPQHPVFDDKNWKQRKAEESDETLHQPQDSTFDDESCLNQDIETPFYLEKYENDRIYNCKKCDVKFDIFEEYSKHRLSEEHENQRHTCPICKKSYSSLYFKKHMALHTLDKSYMCDICGNKFLQKGQFTRHRFTHFHKFPFKCSLCPYRGRFPESLKMHMRSHTGEKPYNCLHCTSKFVSKSNLNKHMRIHKDDFDFKCETCGKGFHAKINLERHFQVDHTGIKDHICNICGKAFGYRKQMMKHQLKVHKREKFKSGRRPLYLEIEAEKMENVQSPTKTCC